MPRRLSTDRRWRLTIAWLRRTHGLRERVYVVDGLSDHGSSEGKSIKIRAQDPFSVRVDSLLHEVAHVLTDDDPEEHGKRWGARYGELHDSFFSWNYERGRDG